MGSAASYMAARRFDNAARFPTPPGRTRATMRTLFSPSPRWADGLRLLMSTTTAGLASGIANCGGRLWPPANGLARPSQRARRKMTSSMRGAAKQSDLPSFMINTSGCRQPSGYDGRPLSARPSTRSTCTLSTRNRQQNQDRRGSAPNTNGRPGTNVARRRVGLPAVVAVLPEGRHRASGLLAHAITPGSAREHSRMATLRAWARLGWGRFVAALPLVRVVGDTGIEPVTSSV